MCGVTALRRLEKAVELFAVAGQVADRPDVRAKPHSSCRQLPSSHPAAVPLKMERVRRPTSGSSVIVSGTSGWNTAKPGQLVRHDLLGQLLAAERARRGEEPFEEGDRALRQLADGPVEELEPP
ncbi:MAG: hypothetical protein ACYCTE_13760 [Acidimicrobiales bacterium]